MPTFRPTTPKSIQLQFTGGHGTRNPDYLSWINENQHLRNEMTTLPEHGTILIPNQYATNDEQKYFLIRLDNILNTDEMKDIEDRWEEFLALDPKCHETKKKAKARSITGEVAWHFGYWERQGNPPMVSRDTRQPGGGTLEKRKAGLVFLATLDKYFGYKLKKRLERLDKKQLKYMGARPVLATMKLKEVSEELLDEVERETQGKALRLGGLGTMVAVAPGQSGAPHLDLNDDRRGYTVVVPVSTRGWGDREGERTGMLEIPQLGYKVPCLPGQAIAFQSWRLLHSSSQIEEARMKDRMALTVFGCRNIGKKVAQLFEE